MWKKGVESEREMKNENSSFAKFRSTRDKRLSKTQGFVLFTDLWRLVYSWVGGVGAEGVGGGWDAVGSVYKPNLGWKWGGTGSRQATSAVDGTMWDGDKWNNMQSDKEECGRLLVQVTIPLLHK